LVVRSIRVWDMNTGSFSTVVGVVDCSESKSVEK